jgi:DNA-damage-inducible protein D
VRSAIEEIGGTMPENIPPAEPIKNVEKRLKKRTSLLRFDNKETAGPVPEVN